MDPVEDEIKPKDGEQAPVVEPKPAVSKPPESLPSKFEKAVMDELNAVKEFVSYEPNKKQRAAVVEPSPEEVPGPEHADSCWCPLCLFDKDE